ncbi:hypothetical protein HJC99_06565 [Candidatus Saccharibacteria bacterium]|nr:hypothetical protein [Candidatus Saccharibacteria bacterium]
MKRDTVKTIAGIIVIAAIVVATYFYGNHQRQQQLRQEQALRQQQQTTTSPTATTAPASVATVSGSGTAPVASVQPNAIQGSGAATPTATAKATATPIATPTVTPVATSNSSVSISQGTLAPAPGAGTQPLADTGSGLSTALQVSLIALASIFLVRSRRGVALALRSNRS